MILMYLPAKVSGHLDGHLSTQSNTMKTRVTAILLFCSLAAICNSSKCPEARKPHGTECSVYYECINLPEGGYVWAPAKCQDGLVSYSVMSL